eukprot:GILI01067358.1.p1 GENE.GILI01067358.1~~GILI01067358.1.p1  ORF type:complete len:110 (+),score=5.64 GILI01067358.1:49-330(+)
MEPEVEPEAKLFEVSGVAVSAASSPGEAVTKPFNMRRLVSKLLRIWGCGHFVSVPHRLETLALLNVYSRSLSNDSSSSQSVPLVAKLVPKTPP